MKQYEVAGEVLNEVQLYEQYKKGFTKYSERCLDLANYPCLSCDKLCYKRECSHLRNLRSLPSCRDWDASMKIDLNLVIAFQMVISVTTVCDILDQDICHQGVLNNLQFGDIPKEISILNSFESVFIQRAKAFQTVTRLCTVAKRKLPPSHRIKKVCGSPFHLPLPLEETLKQLPDPDQALPNHGELYVLLRSIPSQSKVIWQDLVSVQNVYDALLKLKEINPLYHPIKLPRDAEELDLEQYIDEFETPQSSDAMVQHVS